MFTPTRIYESCFRALVAFAVYAYYVLSASPPPPPVPIPAALTVATNARRVIDYDTITVRFRGTFRFSHARRKNRDAQPRRCVSVSYDRLPFSHRRHRSRPYGTTLLCSAGDFGNAHGDRFSVFVQFKNSPSDGFRFNGTFVPTENYFSTLYYIARACNFDLVETY